MGEIADMMINGDLCYFCGVVIYNKGESYGFPVYCSVKCRNEHDIDNKYPTSKELRKGRRKWKT